MADPNLPIPNKCTWWREAPHDDDTWDVRLKKEDKRVSCTCFIEGQAWLHAAKDVPKDCPHMYTCRYYIKSV